MVEKVDELLVAMFAQIRVQLQQQNVDVEEDATPQLLIDDCLQASHVLEMWKK
jgi:hypothetical protein